MFGKEKRLFASEKDVVMYVAALIEVANADGELKETERAMIVKLAKQFTEMYDSNRQFNDLVYKVHLNGKSQLKVWLDGLRIRGLSFARALLADMILMGHCDGDYCEKEKKIVDEFAKSLGLQDCLKDIESCVAAWIEEQKKLAEVIENGVLQAVYKKGKTEDIDVYNRRVTSRVNKVERQNVR